MIMHIDVSEKDQTKNVHLNLSDISDRIYIESKIWVFTAYGEIKIGIVDGPIYKLSEGELVKI